MNVEIIELYDKIWENYINWILCQLNIVNELVKLENQNLDEYMKNPIGNKKIKSLYGDHLYLQTASDFKYTTCLGFVFDTEELSKKMECF